MVLDDETIMMVLDNEIITELETWLEIYKDNLSKLELEVG